MTTLSEIPEELTVDDFLGGAVRLTQPAKGFRAGTDTVLLAASVPASSGAAILDIGAGVGGIALCLARRLPGVTVTALEWDAPTVDLARRNIELNGLENRVSVVAGDLAHPPRVLRRGHYDQLVSNPPYFEAGRATPPPHGAKAAAHVGRGMTLEAWILACMRFLKPRGQASFILPASRLDHAIAALMQARGGDIRIFPLWPKRGRAAQRIIVTARRGTKGPLQLLPGLVLHEDDGLFTPKARAIMRLGDGLDLAQDWAFQTPHPDSFEDEE